MPSDQTTRARRFTTDSVYAGFGAPGGSKRIRFTAETLRTQKELRSESGTFQGKSAVEGWFRHFFEQFPGIGFDIQDLCVRNIFDLSGTNVVAVHWNLQLTNSVPARRAAFLRWRGQLAIGLLIKKHVQDH